MNVQDSTGLGFPITPEIEGPVSPVCCDERTENIHGTLQDRMYYKGSPQCDEGVDG